MLQAEGPRVAFRDNDGLAALLAIELKADLLILLTDVAGLYDGPPSDPNSNFIATYCPEVHDDLIKFGNPSSGGRGGMVSKVGSWHCAAPPSPTPPRPFLDAIEPLLRLDQNQLFTMQKNCAIIATMHKPGQSPAQVACQT